MIHISSRSVLTTSLLAVAACFVFSGAFAASKHSQTTQGLDQLIPQDKWAGAGLTKLTPTEQQSLADDISSLLTTSRASHCFRQRPHPMAQVATPHDQGRCSQTPRRTHHRLRLPLRRIVVLPRRRCHLHQQRPPRHVDGRLKHQPPSPVRARLQPLRKKLSFRGRRCPRNLLFLGFAPALVPCVLPSNDRQPSFRACLRQAGEARNLSSIPASCLRFPSRPIPALVLRFLCGPQCPLW
jgi:hypothetical protein